MQFFAEATGQQSYNLISNQFWIVISGWLNITKSYLCGASQPLCVPVVTQTPCGNKSRQNASLLHRTLPWLQTLNNSRRWDVWNLTAATNKRFQSPTQVPRDWSQKATITSYTISGSRKTLSTVCLARPAQVAYTKCEPWVFVDGKTLAYSIKQRTSKAKGGKEGTKERGPKSEPEEKIPNWVTMGQRNNWCVG